MNSGGEGNGAQVHSAFYRLPVLDTDFLLRDWKVVTIQPLRGRAEALTILTRKLISKPFSCAREFCGMTC